ncbi:sugar transferase [Levilactobacillus brevis]|uniref:sugar transferase n=1 Tax=Levilactobacillus brevis TaxID=1580 RepID=UPI0021A633B5|nr:sugar transferase [Levilactobacillus brevis]MCT3597262.1 sugar transferase [Levilactobacillus brevis]
MEINTDVSSKIDSESVEYKQDFSKVYLIEKRIFDIIVSLFAIFFLSPIFLAVCLLDHFSQVNKGPVFYQQERVGLHGKKFGMYKFRSMIVDADKVLKDDSALYSKYVKNNFKLEPDDDPRITKLGRVLRRTSIDEIPQFINVLKGDMSLIGPRPVVEPELAEYDAGKLLSVKPGAMGLWQASGRSMIGYPKRAEIEMRYIDNASFGYDLEIICKNVLKIISKKGAY